MKRILLAGFAVVVGSLGGCVADKKEPNHPISSQATPLPADSEAVRATKQRLQEDLAGVKVLIVMACSEKLHIPTLDRPEDLAAVGKCTNDQIKVFGKEALARIEARELTENEAGQFMLNQAVGFLQANSEGARTRDSAELIQIAVEGGSRLLLSKPE
ncbi:hypothetical protein C1X64_27030 [Pseudomonas sp. GW456-E7]|nr:hypothetical protein C1X64_27030 [Pseudomonas sp. GW456-E7]